MFTDIVGYSKKIQKDQALTLAALEDHNKIVQKNIESHQGRVVKFPLRYSPVSYLKSIVWNGRILTPLIRQLLFSMPFRKMPECILSFMILTVGW